MNCDHQMDRLAQEAAASAEQLRQILDTAETRAERLSKRAIAVIDRTVRETGDEDIKHLAIIAALRKDGVRDEAFDLFEACGDMTDQIPYRVRRLIALVGRPERHFSKRTRLIEKRHAAARLLAKLQARGEPRPSISQLARDVGVQRSTVRHWLASADFEAECRRGVEALGPTRALRDFVHRVHKPRHERGRATER